MFLVWFDMRYAVRLRTTHKHAVSRINVYDPRSGLTILWIISTTTANYIVKRRLRPPICPHARRKGTEWKQMKARHKQPASEREKQRQMQSDKQSKCDSVRGSKRKLKHSAATIQLDTAMERNSTDSFIITLVRCARRASDYGLRLVYAEKLWQLLIISNSCGCCWICVRNNIKSAIILIVCVW